METYYPEIAQARPRIARERVLADLKILARDSEELLIATAHETSERVKAARSRVTPAHGIAPELDGSKLKPGEGSPMPDYTSRMTVRQMTDIVTFEGAHYEEVALNAPHPHPDHDMLQG